MRFSTAVTTVGAALAAAGTTAGFAVSAQARTAPVRATGAPIQTGVCGITKVRPPLIGLSVDGSGFLAGYKAPGHFKYTYDGHLPGIDWTSWGTTSATGTGYLYLDTSRPSVGQGTLYGFKAIIKLSRPLNGTFTKMVIDSNVSPAFENYYQVIWPSVDTLTASKCKGGGISWN